MMRILIDPGHGGKDPGAVSPPHAEAAINLEVGHALAGWLQKNTEHDVLMTRVMDIYVSPGDRSWAIQHAEADFNISLHCNAAGSPEAQGIEVIYRDPLEKVAGDKILASIKKKFPSLKVRGTKHDQKELQRSLAVLNNAEGTVTVLVEMGFITNAKDCEVLLQYDALAQAIGEGILQSLQEG